MKICMIAHHGCIRVWKEGQMLMDEGHEVSIITQRIQSIELDRWHSWSFYQSTEQLRHAIEVYDRADYDIFHVHNEPDWIVNVTRNSTKKTVIFDIHDLESARVFTVVPKQEIEIIRGVDGIINVSEPMEKEVSYWHQPKCPMIVIYTYNPEKWFLPKEEILNCKRIPNSILYEGGLTEPFCEAEKTKEVGGRNDVVYFSFRDLGHIFKAFIDAGMNVHIYPCELLPELKGYKTIGCYIHTPVPSEQMPQEFKQYEWNFAGANSPIPLLDKAFANKLVEPMAGGCVPVVYCAREMEKWVLQNKFGINIDIPSPVEIKEKMFNKVPIEYRKNFLDQRHNFSMESQYDKLMEFYKKALIYNYINRRLRLNGDFYKQTEKKDDCIKANNTILS